MRFLEKLPNKPIFYSITILFFLLLFNCLSILMSLNNTNVLLDFFSLRHCDIMNIFQSIAYYPTKTVISNIPTTLMKSALVFWSEILSLFLTTLIYKYKNKHSLSFSSIVKIVFYYSFVIFALVTINFVLTKKPGVDYDLGVDSKYIMDYFHPLYLRGIVFELFGRFFIATVLFASFNELKFFNKRETSN